MRNSGASGCLGFVLIPLLASKEGNGSSVPRPQPQIGGTLLPSAVSAFCHETGAHPPMGDTPILNCSSGIPINVHSIALWMASSSPVPMRGWMETAGHDDDAVIEHTPSGGGSEWPCSHSPSSGAADPPGGRHSTVFSPTEFRGSAAWDLAREGGV